MGGTRNVVGAIKAQPDPDAVRLVHIGSVAQTGHRPAPIHWGRTGDPIKISKYDHYARTKTEAEAPVAESGLSHWVSNTADAFDFQGLRRRGRAALVG